jgi:integrase
VPGGTLIGSFGTIQPAPGYRSVTVVYWLLRFPLKLGSDRGAFDGQTVTIGRDYLTGREVERLIDAAKGNRHGHRDATAILIAYRHGLRSSELVGLRWDDVELQTGRLHVRRAKGAVHPISAKESRALRRGSLARSPYVFVCIRNGARR